MTVNAKTLIQSKEAETAETVQYTVPPLTRTIIDKFTVTNVSAVPVPFVARIIPVGGAAGVGNTIAPNRSIQVGEAYTFPELVGHIMGPGDFISTLAGGVGLALRASGREVS